MPIKKIPKSISAILDRNNAPILRAVAAPVELKAITSKKIKDVIARMSKALDAEEDGVALAAPQIGESLRIFIVSGRVSSMELRSKKIKKAEATEPGMGIVVEGEPLEKKPNMIYINPVISKLSRKKELLEEGCLSVRWLYGKVMRSEKATIKAYDQNGILFTTGASGLVAQAFQHEMDHLEGILFIDKAVDIENNPPKNELADEPAKN